MSEMDLLDPRASDRFLRAYAFLASQYAGGARSAIESLLPFVERAIAEHKDQQFDEGIICRFVENTYRVRIPIYMMDSFKRKLEESGFVERPKFAPDIYVCKAKATSESVKSSTLSNTDLQDFERAISEYAERRRLGKPLASDNWGEALIKFYGGWDERKTATIDHQLIYDGKRVDDAVVSGFIKSQDKNSFHYEVAKRLYFGVLVADFFTCMSEISNKDSLKEVDLVLDTTLLMRLLGTSGNLLREATHELVRDIQELGGRAFYFSHTYEEMIESLEALSYQVENRVEMNRESANALASGETSLSSIQLLVREADIRLGEFGLTEHSEVYDSNNDEFQIDEEAFIQQIGGPRPDDHRVRWERDAQSLALVSRIRMGVQSRKLSSAKAIFVTHNGTLARTAREFLRISAFDIPPILTTNQISVLAWLERGGGISDQELNAKLAAACYEAVIPREGWEVQFWEKLEELKESDEYRDRLNSQVTTNAMRSAILDRTFGEPSLVKKMELRPILREVAANAEAELLERHAAGVEEGMRLAQENRKLTSKARSIKLAGLAVSLLSGSLMLFSSILLIYVSVVMVFNPSERSWKYFTYAAITLVLSLVTLLAMFGNVLSIAKAKDSLRDAIASLILRILG